LPESHQRVEEAIAAFKRGELIVVADDDDRENEGDLFVAASLCTPEKMAFIIRHTSGIVCAPVAAEDARRLHLDPMVAANDAPLGTAFTVSVDYRHGLTTGISAEERNNTVRGLANGNSGAGDFVRPGHVFPLVAKQGGVLMRSGHTEACVDLCRLAGLPTVGVLSELMNDDGTVMRGPQLAAFAKQHKLRSVTIADLISYRQAFAYVTPFDQVRHMAFILGDIGDGKSVLTRLHRGHMIGDVLGGAKVLRRAMAKIKEEGNGVIVYLQDGGAGVPSTALPSQEASSENTRTKQWREVGLGAQILKDLGISSIRLLVSANTTYIGVTGFGIEIESTEHIPKP
jgi:3,4-dihydroxy 2-butanone 4-phosphate synthase/GTP cyclohydrolase II